LPEEDSTTYFFLFHTIHDVLKAESVLKSQGRLFELVPVPRTLSSDCGVCITSRTRSDDIVPLLFSLNVDRCFLFNGKEFRQIVPDGPTSVRDKQPEESKKE
jgi:hypothetical protein